MVSASPPSPPPARTPSAPATAWPASVQLALAFLLGITTTLLLVQAFGAWRWGSRPSELQPHTQRIDLNRADRVELLQLPGVGDSLAQRIEDHRTHKGGFQSVDELRDVPGVGPATVERLRDWVRVEGSEKSAPAMSSGSKKALAGSERINVNKASADELQRLPGIGPKLAQRMIEVRQKKSFQSVEDLRRVSGIGPKTVEKLRPLVNTN